MITSLFKNNAISYLIILVVASAIWLWNYIGLSGTENFSMLFGGEKLTVNKQNLIIFSFFFTLIPAWFINYRLKQQLFSYEPTNIFLFFYVIIMGLGIKSQGYIVYLVLSLLLVIFVSYLISFRDKESNVNPIFNSAFILGALMFHNLFFALLLLVLIQNLNTFKRITIKELFVVITGFTLPYLLILAFSELTDNYRFLTSVFELNFQSPAFNYAEWIFVFILTTLGFMGYKVVIQKRTGIDVTIIRLTKNLFSFYLGSILLAVVSLFLELFEFTYFILAIPLSVFLSDYFANSKFKWKEPLFILVVLAFSYHLF
ncbi:hypothetical protein N8289_02010 [Flavobacteriales bacterium]|nr:hypothetical protein [Flavobacteriales bacterium]